MPIQKMTIQTRKYTDNNTKNEPNITWYNNTMNKHGNK